MTRQAYVFPEQELVLFWTPKAACTTIARSICTKLLKKPLEDFGDEPGGMRGYLRRADFWRSGEDGAALCREKRYRSIALIREPYDRLISAYINKYVQSKSRPIASVEAMEPFARAFYVNVIKPRLGHSDETPYPGVTFREFAFAVCNRINARRNQEPRLDHHWNTQIPFSFEKDRFEYDEIYALTSADTFFERLSILLGVEMDNEQHNATQYEKISTTPLQNVTSLALLQLGSYDKSQFRGPAIAKAVERAFAIDYRYLEKAK
jgi:Sulfotransferase family